MKTMMFNIKQIMKGEEPFINVWYYLQGTYRTFMYYSLGRFLIRKHIREQLVKNLVILR